MTCIVGLVHDDGRVWIGGDSCGIDDNYDATERTDTKVFKVKDVVIGFTDSFRMGQLLAYRLEVPVRKANTDLMKYMVTEFVDAVRACLKKGGYAETKHEAERGGEFMVGIEGRLFHIYGDYQVGESSRGYDSCGCGMGYALGSMYTTYGQDPDARITQALRAAAAFSGGVRSPFNVVTTSGKKGR